MIAPRHLQGFDLVISWSLDYVFTDQELLNLLAAVRSSGVHYLMCSISARLGPMRKLVYLTRMSERKKKGGIRMHGWMRSPAYYRKLAGRAGLSCAYLGHRGVFCYFLFT